MRTRNADLTTVDPDDTAAARAWASRRAAAQQRLAAAKVELAQLNTTLARPPASTVLGQLSAADTTTAQAQIAATNAATQATTDLGAAAHFESNDLAEDQGAVDAATRALSETLAALLRDASTTSALAATVDGLALRQRYLTGSATPTRWDHTTLPFLAEIGDQPLDPELVLPVVNSTDYDQLMAVLARLDAGVDAVADLVTAESVHQLVQGNLVRSGAALDVASTGAVPDTFDVIRTPQDGESVTHRVLLVSDTATPPAWPAETGPAVLADPLLASWLTTLLPAPSAVGLTAARRDPATGQLGHPYDLTLDQLGLDPIELIRVAADRGELSQRIALLARQHWVAELGDAANTGSVDVTSVGAPFSLAEFVAAAELARGLVGRARALSVEDLSEPTKTPLPVAAATVTELTARVSAVETALTADVAALEAAVAGPDRLAVAEALLHTARWAVPGVTPQLDTDLPALAVLRSQGQRAATELTRRQAGEPFVPVADDPDLTVRRARDRLVALLGRTLPVLIPVSAPTGPAWTAVAGGSPLSGAEPPALRHWLDAYSRVRPTVAALADAYDLAETWGTGGTLDLAATQLLPDGPGTSWRGADPQPPAGLINIVVQRAFSGAPHSLTGLAVDGWTQRVPATQHQAAVAFHYNQPDASPPQAVLVAVAPDLSAARQPSSWDLETLAEVVLSTLALARQRAVAAENATAHGITVKEV